MPRTYEPVWQTIKEKKSVKVACANDMRARIKKAVIKEKNMDTEFKDKTTGIYRLKVVMGNGFVLFRLSHALKYTSPDSL